MPHNHLEDPQFNYSGPHLKGLEDTDPHQEQHTRKHQESRKGKETKYTTGIS